MNAIRNLGLSIIYLLVAALRSNPRNGRTHSKRQIQQIAASITEFGFNNPVLIDRNNTIIAGHGRVEAAKLLGMTDVPTIRLEDLTEDQIRAYIITDNRVAEKAGWDPSILAIELQHLLTIDTDLDITVTGFEIPEIDLILSQPIAEQDKDDAFEIDPTGPAVSQSGDLWHLAKHRLLCGNALDETSYRTLMGAIYTRKSSEEGLEQSFNSLEAQREACGAFILSQKHEGWTPLAKRYDDGGFSGGSMERPALEQLLSDIQAGEVDTVVVYKVDRLTRSLTDFAKMIEIFDSHAISFVSVTQQFNTTTSMGRLTLNVLLSFAQFEREITGERIRDKIAASKKKGMWMGGTVPFGYECVDHRLVINQAEADRVQEIFRRYLQSGSVNRLKTLLDGEQIRTKIRTSRSGRISGGESVLAGSSLSSVEQSRLYR